MTRLPTPGSDDGTWGDILNAFLDVEHNADGTLKIRTDGSVAPLSSGKVPPANLGTGTANASSYLRGDGAWTVPPTAPVVSVNSQTGAVVLDKTSVGLGSVDNTSDAAKDSAATTLTNKTISGASNTLSNIPQSAVTNLSSDLGGKLAAASNLSDVASPSTARTNLGLATVASTGSYNDLSNKPAVPAIDATATDIQPLGTQTAGSVGKAADAGHVHAMPRLDQVGAPTASVALNSQKITGLANGTAASDAAAFGQIPNVGTTGVGGDLSGTVGNATVAKINGVSMPASAPTGTGLVLTSTSTSAAAWSAAATGAAAALPTSISATGRFDPVSHVYTPTGAGMVKLHAQLGKVRAGTARAKIAFIGASNVAGYNGTASLRGYGDYPSQFASEIDAAGYDTAEPVFTFCDAVAGDNRITTLTGTWNYSAHPAADVLLIGQAGAVLGVTCTRASDTVEISVSGNSAAYTITIDGVLITSGVTVTNGTFSSNFVAPGGSTTAYCKAKVSGLPKAPHTITISCVGGVVLSYIDAYLSNSVSVANFGSSGTRTADWKDTTNYYNLIQTALAWGPDIVVFDTAIMFNSWQNSEPLATSLTNLESIASTLTTAGCEVFLYGIGPATSPVTGVPPLAFYQNLFSLADATSLPLLELYSAWGSSATSVVTLGLVNSTDNVHPTQTGYATMARLLAAAFGVVSWKQKNPISANGGTVTAAATLASNSFTRCNPDTAAFTATLPTTPADGTTVGVRHVGATTKTVTIAAGGSDTINSVGSTVNSVGLVSPGQTIIFMYFAGSTSWLPIASSHALLTDSLSEPLWHPADNNLIAANFDPASISATGGVLAAGALLLMQVKVPANKVINNVILDVVVAGASLTAGTSCLAAVYEADGTRSGITADQATNWQSTGVKITALTSPVAAKPYARTVWVGFIAAGTTLPKMGYNGGSATGNIGLAGAGAQVAGVVLGQSTCPASFTLSSMGATFKYWVGLS